MNVKTQNNKRSLLHDAVDIISISTHSLESDDFHKCFQPISRHEMDSSGIFYIFSFFIRYFILLPIRLLFLVLALVFYALLISKALIKNCENEMKFAYIFIIKAINFIVGAKITHHGKKCNLNRPHIFVSNHTSFVDFIILSNHGRPHACVSENHGGLFYLLFNLILGKNGSIAFKRSEKLDRAKVKEKMKIHLAHNKLPLLVFPEGTCVNNKYSVMFQKGVFELDVDICPVSLKYKGTLMDPYWNRRKQGFALHLLYLMTRWYIEADVYWHSPATRKENETPSEFGDRVKALISDKAGLINTLWNGYLKSSPALKEKDLLKVAFIKTYCLLRECYIEKEEYKFTTYKMFLFGSIQYEVFLLEILKRYHDIKSLQPVEQNTLISSINTCSLVRLFNKKKCSCKAHITKKSKNRYKFKNCRLEVFRRMM